MQDPLLRDIRRARACRSRELARDIHRALQKSYERSFTTGHDVVKLDPFTGEVHVLFKAEVREETRRLSTLERILERKRVSPTRAFKLQFLENRAAADADNNPGAAAPSMERHAGNERR